MRWLQIGLLGMAALAAAILGYLFYRGDEARETLLPAVEIGGPFRLASASGGVIDSAQLAGKSYGVFFGYTHCPEVCPTTLYEMTQALAKLGDAAKDFRLFFITVDPERDSAAYLKDYLANFDPRIEALVPTAAELADVARAFRVHYAKVPTSDGGYAMDHSAGVYLIDRKGHFRGVISYDETPETRLAKLRRLIEGG